MRIELLVMKKMKTLKIVLALAAVIGIVTLTVGLTLAHYNNAPYDYTNSAENEGWWAQMREYMNARWTGIEHEEWFDDMDEYMEEHWNEVQNQEWFNHMLEYMEEQGYDHYRYRNYEDNYYGLKGYSGRGCWGWYPLP